jgi:hypothetical protein
MEDRGGQLAGDLVHIGDHQQQPLRGREGRGQRTGLQAPCTAPAAPSDCISTTTFGPLSLLGAQLVYLGQPLLGRVAPDDQLVALARMLENRADTEAFINLLREEALN